MANENNELKAAGPGAVEAQEADLDPTLKGFTEQDWVDITNPMTVPFAGKTGSTVPVNVPFEVRQTPNVETTTKTENDVRNLYGLPLKNPSHQGIKHVESITTIGPGQTLRVQGDVAQILVRQLVNELMQRADQGLFIADSHARQKYEEMVIMGTGRISDIIARPIQTVSEQLQEAIDEEQFPDVQPRSDDSGSKTSGGETTSTTQSDQSSRKPGRPKKD